MPPCLSLRFSPQTTAAVPVDASRLASTMARGKGAGASFDPGARLLDDKLAKAKAKQAARDAEWKAKVQGRTCGCGPKDNVMIDIGGTAGRVAVTCTGLLPRLLPSMRSGAAGRPWCTPTPE
jgi:hypothetical protein